MTSFQGFRPALESLDPAEYLGSSYYERWLRVVEQALLGRGVITRDELAAKQALYTANPEAGVPRREDPVLEIGVPTSGSTAFSRRRKARVAPAFGAGDTVLARNVHPKGHTRLPRYVRGKRGAVARYLGVHDLDDAKAAGLGAQSQPLYSVRFEGAELWGASAEPNQCVYIDMWESYLEPV